MALVSVNWIGGLGNPGQVTLRTSVQEVAGNDGDAWSRYVWPPSADNNTWNPGFGDDTNPTACKDGCVFPPDTTAIARGTSVKYPPPARKRLFPYVIAPSPSVATGCCVQPVALVELNNSRVSPAATNVSAAKVPVCKSPVS